MRIAHIIASVDPKFGGGTIAFRELTVACADAGAHVHQFFTLPEGLQASDLQTPGKSLPYSVVYRERGDSWGAALALCKVLQEEHRFQAFDIIHIHGLWLPLVVAAAFWAHLQEVPVVTSTHGMLLPWAFAYKQRKKSVAWTLYQRALLKNCACIHTTSDAEANEVERRKLGVPVAVIPLGITPPPVSGSLVGENGSRPRVVLYLGRLHPVKNLPSLLRAWAAAPRPGWELHLVGPQEEGHGDVLRALAQTLGLASTVRFLGSANEAEKWAAIERCEALVLPSYSENFGIVVAEALAMRRPVLASKGTPWRDLETHRCGWWVDPSVDGLAAGLTQITHSQHSELAAMGERGLRLVQEHYLWSSTGRQLVALYRSILDPQVSREANVRGPQFPVPRPLVRAREREGPSVIRNSSGPFHLKTHGSTGRRIAIITFHRAHNFGAVLQGYALQEALRAAGAQPYFIDYDPDYIERGGAWEWPISRWALRANLVNGWLRYAYWREVLFSTSRRRPLYADFHRRFLITGDRKYRSLAELRKNPPLADAYVVGSDQVWNPTKLYGIDPAFLLDFGPKRMLRYSYAASFGRSSIEAVHAPLLRQALPRFKRVSVREESGQGMVQEFSGIEARCDMDPTFLIDSFDAVTAPVQRQQPFIFCYVLRSGHALSSTLARLSHRTGAEVVYARNPQQRWRLPGLAVDCGPMEWLGHIKNARFVVTNSYHGTIFAILFNRPFLTMGLSAEKASLNERALSLLKKLGLAHRLVSDPSDAQLEMLLSEAIDWPSVNKTVCRLRATSQNYLTELSGLGVPA